MGNLNKILKILLSNSEKIKQLSTKFGQNANILSNPTTKNNLHIPNLNGKKIFYFLLLFYFFFYFYQYNFSFSAILSQIDTLLLNLFSIINYQQIIGLNGISILSLFLTTSIFIIFLTSIFGSIFSEDWQRLIQVEFKYFALIIVFIIIGFSSWNSLWINSITDLSPTTSVDNVINKSSQNIGSLWERITCSLDSVCVQSKLNENNAKTSTITHYSLNFNSKSEFYGQDILFSDLKEPIILNYEITSSGELTLNKIECYLDKISNKSLFFSQIKNLKIPKTNGNAIPLENIYCANLQKTISKVQTKNSSKHSIIIKSYYTFTTKYSQTIPIVDYIEFIKSENLNPNKKYSNFILKNKLNKLTSNLKTFIQSNDALKVDDNIIIKQLPLLLGDKKDKKISFPLSITVKTAGDFGTFKSGEIINIELPSSLKFQSSVEDYKRNIKTSNDKFQQRINLIENEAGINTQNKLISTQDLNINILSNFEREDKIKFNVIEFPTNKIININSSSINNTNQ